MKKQFYILPAVLIIILISSCSTVNSHNTAVPKTVSNFMIKHGPDLSNYEISKTDISDYKSSVLLSYDVYDDIETVWRDYNKADPSGAFTSPIIDFGVVYNPEDSVIYTADAPKVPRFALGQIYLLNLKFMGIYNFPIGFKLNKIDAEKKLIEFIYLKDCISNGFQQITLKPDFDSKGTPVTRIEHISFFKTDSGFIENVIYPSFHRRTIDDYHENVFRQSKLSWNIP